MMVTPVPTWPITVRSSFFPIGMRSPLCEARC
jgi:hypothetical protein